VTSAQASPPGPQQADPQQNAVRAALAKPAPAGALVIFRGFIRGFMALLLLGSALALREVWKYPVLKTKLFLGFLCVFFAMGLIGSVLMPPI
jgi:hypothetical protein